MIEGNLKFPLFDAEFIIERCFTHEATIDKYFENLKEFMLFCQNIEQYDSVTLWFGHDTFCQINLLTVLTYLEQRAFKGKVYSIIIDDATKMVVQEKTLIQINGFIDIYKALFFEGKIIESGNKYLDQGIREYIELKSETNDIVRYIKNNYKEVSNKELVDTVWDMTRKYGLGDVQVYKLIEKYSV